MVKFFEAFKVRREHDLHSYSPLIICSPYKNYLVASRKQGLGRDGLEGSERR